MAKSLKDLLGGQRLTTAAQLVKTGYPDFLPPAFLGLLNGTNNAKKIIGNQVAWNQINNGGRELATLVEYEGPSVLVGKSGVSRKTAVMIHSFEHQKHSPSTLKNLASQDSDSTALQSMAYDEIIRQQNEFSARYNNLRGAAVLSALANGKIWFNSEGRFLHSATNAATIVDYGIPAANTGTGVGWVGGSATESAIITTSWATSGADIVGNLGTIADTAIRRTGYPLKHAFYGSNIPGYIFNNNKASAFVAGSPVLSLQMWQSGQIPQGFQGFQWHPMGGAFAQNTLGATQGIFNADSIAFTPEPSADWYEFLEGSYEVPRTFGPMADALAAARSLMTVFGKFSWAELVSDPVAIKHLAGDTFLPIIKVPGAIFIIDVTP